MGGNCDTGEIVIRERWVTNVARNQNLFLRSTGKVTFTIAEMAVL